MEVKDKIMYHYHNKDIYSYIWQVGNTIIVDDNFNSSLCEVTKIFTPAVNVEYKDGVKRQSFDRVLQDYLDDDNFNTINKELAIKMLKETIRIIKGTNLCRRECLLEEYRKKHYSTLPSRYHSIWLTDEETLDFWEEKLKTNYLKLFKLQVTGELFKSSDIYIPDDYQTMEEMYEQCSKYWNPDFRDEIANERVEYLFQGKVKVLDVKDIKK